MMVSAKKVVKGFVLRIWAKDLINQWSFETRAAVTHFRSWALFRGRFREKKGAQGQGRMRRERGSRLDQYRS
jgi:hypothetical protein